MPTNRTIRKQPLRAGAELTPTIRWALEMGDDTFGDFRELNKDELEHKLKELWERHRGDVMKRYIAERPGKRPAMWWLYDSPEPRPQIDWSNPDYTRQDPYWKARIEHRTKEIAVLLRHGFLSKAEIHALENPPATAKP